MSLRCHTPCDTEAQRIAPSATNDVARSGSELGERAGSALIDRAGRTSRPKGGIALLGVVTASIASWLIGRVRDAEVSAEVRLNRRLDAIQAEIAERRALMVRSAANASEFRDQISGLPTRPTKARHRVELPQHERASRSCVGSDRNRKRRRRSSQLRLALLGYTRSATATKQRAARSVHRLPRDSRRCADQEDRYGNSDDDVDKYAGPVKPRATRAQARNPGIGLVARGVLLVGKPTKERRQRMERQEVGERRIGYELPVVRRCAFGRDLLFLTDVLQGGRPLNGHVDARYDRLR